MLYLHEELVDMDRAVKNICEDDRDPFPALVAGDLRMPGNTYQRFSTPEEFRKANPSGSTGNPLLTSKEKGFKRSVKKRVSPIVG